MDKLAQDREPDGNATGGPDFDALALNAGRFVEEAGKAALAYLTPLQSGIPATLPEDAADMVRTLGRVAETWMADPARSLEAQAAISGGFIELWTAMMRRAGGEDVGPVAAPDARDKRFSDPDWQDKPVFDFLKQAYLILARWAEEMVEKAEGLDPHTKRKARFYVNQIASAIAPSNFLATNPELLRDTLAENGANLVRGMAMLAEDIEAGHGDLKVRQSDAEPFRIGENIATTPGKVVFRNELIELIQYAPATAKVLARPVLICPPWINKYYILDLNPEKSFIRWAVEQGLTVFCISWVNPDERHAALGFEDYLREGLFEAIDVVLKITRRKDIAAIGYCIGGTLLGMALSLMAARRETKVSSATFFTTQLDFSQAGDLKVFIDEEQISALERRMNAIGYLPGAKMANSFNMLRPNDLIWPYIRNVYVKGQRPTAFDLLYWNADSTRMTAANHSFYLRRCYLENALSKKKMVIEGVRLDLGKVKIPIYNLATREDHIAPARSVFISSQLFGGPVDYVLAGSGHIAGVVNPPSRHKYQYWTGRPAGGDLDDWIADAREHPGSWWPNWFAWLKAQAPAMVKARIPGSGRFKALADAPGTYVRIRS